MKSYKGFFPDPDNSGEVAYYLILPEGKPKCIVQLVHGMCEGGGMYLPFMRYLAKMGCAACAMDLPGHGSSVRDYSELGFFAENEGGLFLVRTLKRFNDMMKKRFPDVPSVIIGHSMGSFITRRFLTLYGSEIDGVILMGTAKRITGQELLPEIGRLLCLYKNGRYHLKLIMYLGCFCFCSKMGIFSFGWDWLSREKRIRKYMDIRAFGYTAKGYGDIAGLLRDISRPEWAESVPKKLPLLLMSGLSDPVGGCGRGVASLYKSLKRAGCENVRVRLYYGARHILLHETNKEQVYNDIYKWLEKNFIEGNDGK